MISGGVGHTTPFLRREIGKRYPDIKMEDRSEADILADYMNAAFHIPQKEVLVENKSANCGENVIFPYQFFQKSGLFPKTVLIMQDSTMQRRMGATFEKVWKNTGSTILSYAAYRAKVVEKGGQLCYENPDIWGLWDLKQYMTLLLGEMARLTDDENGYGPNGKGYIAHVDIPNDVNKAYNALLEQFGSLVRGPWRG